MEFQVHVADEEVHFYHGQSVYKVESGVLTVHNNEDEKVVVYGPGFWQRVEHDTPKY